MQRSNRRQVRHVRQMPKIYGNLQSSRWRPNWQGLLRWARTLTFLGLIGGMGYGLFLSSFFTVRSVQVEGAAFTSQESVAALIPLGSNIWRLPESQIIATLEQQPTTESVRILKGIPHTVRVVITERHPELLWVSGDQEWLIDANGVPFTHFPVAEQPGAGSSLATLLSGVPVIHDTANLSVQEGIQLASPLLISFTRNLNNAWGQTIPEAPVDRFELAGSTYDLAVVTKPGMRVLVSSLTDPQVAVRNLYRLIHQENVPLTAQVNLLIPRWAYVR